jgi:hypothetical protein
MLPSTLSDGIQQDVTPDLEQSNSSKIPNWEKALILLTVLLTMTIADSPRILLWMQHRSARQTVSTSQLISETYR